MRRHLAPFYLRGGRRAHRIQASTSLPPRYGVADVTAESRVFDFGRPPYPLCRAVGPQCRTAMRSWILSRTLALCCFGRGRAAWPSATLSSKRMSNVSVALICQPKASRHTRRLAAYYCLKKEKAHTVERRMEHESNCHVETKPARRGDVCAGWRIEYFGHGKGRDTGDARRRLTRKSYGGTKGVGEEGLGADRRSTGRELHFYQREQ